MEKQNLQELVKKARGDRTKRKYAEDAGVNVAIISRIESGDYRPGKKVLEKLTSVQASPQGGVTYNDLLEAASDNKQYQKGLAAAATLMMTAPLGLIGAAPFMAGAGVAGAATKIHGDKKKKKEDEFLDRMKDFATEMERYRAMATGTILATLAEQGIICRPGKQEDTDFPLNYTDIVLLVEDTEISNWVLSCFTLNENNKNMESFIKPFAARFAEKLLHTKADARKKASFVVDSDELYDYLTDLLKENSYRGNLSIIQFDAQNVKLVREEYISYYELDCKEDKMIIVGEKEEF